MGKEIIETDVLIIGAGIAGCRAAIEACNHGARVVLTTKGLFGRYAFRLAENNGHVSPDAA